MKLIALGSDPELFLEDQTGKVISAIGKIGGTKEKPRPLKDLGKGYYVQEDNVLLEYNTPISKSALSWMSHHHQIMVYLKDMVGQLGLNLSTKASHSMDADQMNHPKAFVFGCEPDYDVWAVRWNPKPEAQDPMLRSAGGHIHVAYENPNPATSIRIGRMMDYFVGARLAQYDPDKRRRELYGRAGAIRFKKYGLEYRTPSNFWTIYQEWTKLAWVNTKIAVENVESYENIEHALLTAKDFLNGKAIDFDQSFLKNFGAY